MFYKCFALSRLGSAPGGRVSLYRIFKCTLIVDNIADFKIALDNKTIFVTVTIIQTYMLKEV